MPAWLETRIPPPVVAAACAGAIWGIARLWPETRIDFPGREAVAFGLLVLGLAMDMVSVAGFFRARTTVSPLAPSKAAKLVTTGLYRLTRNPMYLGMALALSGVAVWMASPWGAAALAVFMAYITRFQILPEERALRERFGADYDAYAARVRRWI